MQDNNLKYGQNRTYVFSINIVLSLEFRFLESKFININENFPYQKTLSREALTYLRETESMFNIHIHTRAYQYVYIFFHTFASIAEGS